MGNAETTLQLPARGTITTWMPDDSIGRIRLATGEELKFGHSACVGVRPALGLEVWVVEVAPHPLGGLRAKVLNATGALTPDRATAALAAHRVREELRPAVEAEVARIKAECHETLGKKPQPWAVAKGAGVAGIAAIESLRGRFARDALAAVVASIPAAGAEDLRLGDLEWADGWAHLEIWTDPCFVPFATDDGNHLGLFAHPAVHRAGCPAPVLFRFHEHDPVFTWVAESAEHLVRMIEAALRGDDIEGLRGARHAEIDALVAATQREEAFEDVERGDVHALLWSGAPVLEAAAAERLEARYRDRRWTFPLASIEAQRALAGWQDRIDAALARLPAIGTT